MRYFMLFVLNLLVRAKVSISIKKDATCDPSYDSGYAAGESAKKNSKLKSDTDKRIQNEASEFKKKIQDALLHSAALI